LKLINEERARNGVPALVVKDDLTEFAVNWARHMRETGFAHSENASGAGPSLTGSRTLTGECIVMWGDASLTGEQSLVSALGRSATPRPRHLQRASGGKPGGRHRRGWPPRRQGP
jgi:hypothetical protein